MTSFLTESEMDRPAESPDDMTKFLAGCKARREAKQAAARKPTAATIARRYVQVDTIIVEPNGHGIGWPSYECERAMHGTSFRNHLTLVEFARQHFKAGILRKIGTNRYAVMVRKAEKPSAWGEAFDRPRAA